MTTDRDCDDALKGVAVGALAYGKTKDTTHEAKGLTLLLEQALIYHRTVQKFREERGLPTTPLEEDDDAATTRRS